MTTDPDPAAALSPKVTAPVAAGAVVTAGLAVASFFGVDIDADPEEVAVGVAGILTLIYGFIGWLRRDPLRR